MTSRIERPRSALQSQLVLSPSSATSTVGSVSVAGGLLQVLTRTTTQEIYGKDPMFSPSIFPKHPDAFPTPTQRWTTSKTNTRAPPRHPIWPPTSLLSRLREERRASKIRKILEDSRNSRVSLMTGEDYGRSSSDQLNRLLMAGPPGSRNSPLRFRLTFHHN